MPWQDYNQFPKQNNSFPNWPGHDMSQPYGSSGNPLYQWQPPKYSGSMGSHEPNFGLPPGYTWNRYTGLVGPNQQGGGSGLPGMGGSNDMMGWIQKMMGQFGMGGAAGAGAPGGFPAAPQGNAGQQYLMQIKDLMAKLGQGGLPNLPPEVQQMLAQSRASQTADINRGFEQQMGSAIAQGYGAGMERSGRANNDIADISGRKSQAISEMLSGLSGQEFGIRSQLGQQQQQGLMGQIGALQQLAQMAEQQQQQQYQNQLQQYNTNLQYGEHGQDRQMQMMQFFMQMFPQLQQMNKANQPPPKYGY